MKANEGILAKFKVIEVLDYNEDTDELVYGKEGIVFAVVHKDIEDIPYVTLIKMRDKHNETEWLSWFPFDGANKNTNKTKWIQTFIDKLGDLGYEATLYQ
jgi:hypothetical protein